MTLAIPWLCNIFYDFTCVYVFFCVHVHMCPILLFARQMTRMTVNWGSLKYLKNKELVISVEMRQVRWIYARISRHSVSRLIWIILLAPVHTKLFKMRTCWPLANVLTLRTGLCYSDQNQDSLFLVWLPLIYTLQQKQATEELRLWVLHPLTSTSNSIKVLIPPDIFWISYYWSWSSLQHFVWKKVKVNGNEKNIRRQVFTENTINSPFWGNLKIPVQV